MSSVGTSGSGPGPGVGSRVACGHREHRSSTSLPRTVVVSKGAISAGASRPAAAAERARRSANAVARGHGRRASSQVVAAYRAVLSSRGEKPSLSSAIERRLRRSSGAGSPRSAAFTAPG